MEQGARIETDAHAAVLGGAQFAVGGRLRLLVLFDEAETKWWGRGRDAEPTLVNVDHGGSASRGRGGAGPRQPRPVQVLRRGLPARGRPGLQRLPSRPGGAQPAAARSPCPTRRRPSRPTAPSTRLLRGLRPEDPAAVPGRRPVDARVLRRRAARRRPPGAALQARPSLGRRGTGHGDAACAAPRQPRRRRLDRLARLRPEARRLHPRRPPAHGRAFRVSTDPAKEFSDTTVPLAQPRRHARGRPHGPALRHAAYEVQEVRIYCDAMQPPGAGFPEHCNLTGSLAQGFRPLGDDDGGDRGGRRRLHGLGRRRRPSRPSSRRSVGIDDVEVTRMEMKKEYGDVLLRPRRLRRRPRQGRCRARRRVAGAGRLPRPRPRTPRRLRHERDGVLQTSERRRCPRGAAQDVGSAPWDAEADDVKYALEARKPVCTVDVERVVERQHAPYGRSAAGLESHDDTRFMFSPLLGLGANEDGSRRRSSRR